MSSIAESNDIAVVGMAGRFPGAPDLDSFWRNLREGIESITFFDDEQLLEHGVPREHLESPNYVKAASVLAEHDRFDARFFGYNAREAAILDPQQRLFLETAWTALEDSGHTPAGFDGSIGVFAAANMSTYLMTNLIAGRSLPPGGDALELVVANDKDYVASRTAYKLNLDGPAVAVQTACSSSLAAVHLAAQSLLGFECDMALAGGVTLRCPQHAGYFYREGMIFSADGHCRPFDAQTTGTIAGSGAGAVVLKRLADALADGDHIDAVLRGSALNNDGAAKIGYTAPSVSGQAEVIAGALAVADIDPATVSAIEAHGTGTPLGDPIEIRALTEAFGDSGARECALGALKGNIGHLDSTAGVAGLIKAVLQIRHGELAPVVNFNSPNPEIDFDATPFQVITEARKWSTGGAPKRIGVSSFGMGGTNVHVVLEEPPARQAPGRAARPQLLPIAARTGTALQQATENLAEALAGGVDGELADVAHTLQSGRSAFSHRRVLVASEPAEAADALREVDPQRVSTHRTDAEPAVVLLFPGQGSQYPNMGLGLYRSEPVFAGHVDACAEALRGELGFDLREVMFPGELPGSEAEAAAERLLQTGVAQPALFTVEYALAELLQSWGVRAGAMIGHSVGEITAACRAGVLSLPDALHLVAVRGRLMQDLRGGSMLSVRLPEDRLRAMLPEGLAIAAVNATELCVVAGLREEVGAFAERLDAEGVATTALHTSHAFHSPMVEPMLRPFADELAGITMHPPQVPYVANLTGTWAGAEQADPAYWVSHVRETVRFADGIATLAETGPHVLLEVGPGQTLGILARANDAARGSTALPTLPGPRDQQPEQEFLLSTLGRMWLAGADVDFAQLHGEQRRRISLPGYPFERRRYWIEPAATPAGEVDIDTPEDPAGREEFTVDALDPRPVLGNDYVEPRTDIERKLVETWQELLGVGPIGVHDPFVELGGHSLLAARVLDRINADLGCALTPRMLFDTPTIAGIAELVDAPSDVYEPAALPVAVPDPESLHEPFPLTEIQQAQWIGRMAGFDVGEVAAHAYWEVELDGIDLERLETSLNQLMDRHQMLRAVILPEGAQRILPDVGPYRIDALDLREDPEAEYRLAELREELSHQVRPSDTWPLFDVRATLFEDRTILHLSFDLLIADIGSLRILLRDWRRIYQHGPESLPPVELSYRDYALAAAEVRTTSLYQRSLTYWREHVRDLPPAPDLPLAVAPGSVPRPEFVARRAVIPRELWDRFVANGSRHGVTGSAALLAVYAQVLGTWCRAGRFTLNVTLTNRLDVHEQVPDLVGEFASFDLLPVDLTDSPAIEEVARRLQEQAWQDLEYRYLNGVEVLREMARQRGGTSGAVMPVVFTSTLVQQSEPGDESMFGWLGEMVHEIAQTPQVWMDAGVLEVAEGMQLSWHGVRQLFPEGVQDAMFEQFRDLVLRFAEDPDAWETARGALLPGEQRELIAAANATEGPVPEGFLHTPLVEQALQHPERVAIIAGDRELTFGDLHRHACDHARRLRELGVGPNRLVAVAADKSCEQLVAALAVLLAGGAYLPIDTDLPGERQDHLVEQGEVRVVLTRAGGPQREWADGVRTIEVDLDAEVGEVEAPEPVQRPEELAYVIFTSGSTGTPKGVMLSHRASLNTLVDINERFDLGPQDRVLGLSSLSFDLSVWDVFGVLGAGGALVLPEPEARRDPARWLELITEHGVTVWNSVPALMHMFGEYLCGQPEAPQVPLRLALLSGDWIPVDLPDRLRGVMPELDVISLGGATEAAVWSIHYPIGEVDPEWDSIPYGRPLRNQTMHVLDDRLEPCPVWTTGEIYIGGIGVAEGYWRDPERTAAQFLTHPRSGERLYRTGDLGRRLPDGDLEFLGREDFQVKIGGFRIELGEIESALLRCDGVRSAVAAAVGPDRHHRKLAAYIVPGEDVCGEDLTERAWEAMRASLPEYMVPTSLMVLDRLPLTGNGKVDRSALPEPGADRAEASAEVSGGPLARKLAGIVAEVLSLEHVGVHENFFEVGGDSIMGIKIISRAAAEGVEIAPADLFQQQTIAALAAVLEQRGQGLPEDGMRPLSPRQRWVFDRSAPEPPTGAHRVDLTIPDSLTSEEVQRAAELIVARHPALRARFTADDDQWHWHVADSDSASCYVPVLDLAALPEQHRETADRQMVEEMTTELDITTGPLFKLALFDLGQAHRRLTWLIHELAVDVPSWGVLLDEFTRTLNGEELPNTPLPLNPVTTTESDTPEPPLDDALTLPLTEDDSSPQDITGGLDPDQTERLLDGAWHSYRMTPEQVVLAAVAHAARDCRRFRPGEGSRLVADVEHDLREDGELGVGAYGGVAAVGIDLGFAELSGLLEAVKGEHRRSAERAGLAESAEGAQISLRPLLRLSSAAGLVVPVQQSVRLPRPMVVTPVLAGGGLHVSLSAGGSSEDLVCRFSLALREALLAIAEHVSAPEAGRVGEEDFPLAGLDAEELSALLSTVAEDPTSAEEDR